MSIKRKICHLNHFYLCFTNIFEEHSYHREVNNRWNHLTSLCLTNNYITYLTAKHLCSTHYCIIDMTIVTVHYSDCRHICTCIGTLEASGIGMEQRDMEQRYIAYVKYIQPTQYWPCCLWNHLKLWHIAVRVTFNVRISFTLNTPSETNSKETIIQESSKIPSGQNNSWYYIVDCSWLSWAEL